MDTDDTQAEPETTKHDLLDRMAEHGDTVLRYVGVAFALTAVSLFVSLSCKFG